MADNLKIPYGVFDFKRIRREGYYYIDKTGYIPLLEQAGSFLFFVRPRRFGKSLMANMLRCYYDIAEKDNFDTLFGGLEIARNPTENRNRYQVLYMDFSLVNRGSGATLQERFETYIGECMDAFMTRYADQYGAEFTEAYRKASVAARFTKISEYAKLKGFPLYLMLDEYDNFTNQMLRAEGNRPYRDITHGEGFYREWFKSFKAAFDRIYMTGVSPVTMDDLTSGFNIAANISQDADFNSMLGFSEDEVLQLYTDFRGVGKYADGDPAAWVKSFKPWYDGYCFSKSKIGRESVFNSDMVLYHLSALVKTGSAPENMVDNCLVDEIAQLKNCEQFVHQICAPELMSVESVFREILKNGDEALPVLERFDFEALDDQKVFFSLFYYYGILTFVRYYHGRNYHGFPNKMARQVATAFLEKSSK